MLINGLFPMSRMHLCRNVPKVNFKFHVALRSLMAYLTDSSKVIKVGSKQKPYEMWPAVISLAASLLTNSLAGKGRERIWRLCRCLPAHESRQLCRLAP